MSTPSGTGYTHQYFHTNHQGSVIATSNDSAARAGGPYVYDPYGNCFQLTSSCASLGTVPFAFTGQRLDAETGCYYYRARYYCADDLRGGRFLQTDPVGYTADLNLYTYVGNDPVDRQDPSGMDFCQTGSLLPGNAQGCSSSNGNDEVGAQTKKVANQNVAKEHPKEYHAMTEAYRKNFGKEFDPSSSFAHAAATTDVTCQSGPDCSRSSVFGGLTHCPVPTGCAPWAFRNGDVTFAAPVGPVRVEIDPSNYWVMNITVGWHLLYPGVVLREAIQNNSNVGVLSISIGTGRLGGLNSLFTGPIWGYSNLQLQRYMFHVPQAQPTW